jgi:hypothetical protein
MGKLLTTVLIILCVAAAAPAQRRVPGRAEGFRISGERPTVYLTFEKYGKAIDPQGCELARTGEPETSKLPGRDVWLRLHNNTRWAIRMPARQFYFSKKALYRLADGRTVGALWEGAEVNAYYEVAEGNGARAGVRECDIAGAYSLYLPPGTSVIFSVSREYLSGGRSISVEFNYEWERHGAGGREPTHLIRFSGSDLPKEQDKN